MILKIILKQFYILEMIKSRYLLRQEKACMVSGNFVIHEKPENANNNQEQISEISDLHVAPQEFVG